MTLLVRLVINKASVPVSIMPRVGHEKIEAMLEGVHKLAKFFGFEQPELSVADKDYFRLWLCPAMGNSQKIASDLFAVLFNQAMSPASFTILR